MQFLNPLALVGLAAALIPLAIHLLHRGPSRPQPFSNLEFLRRLHHRRMPRLRLRQWLILLVRTLIIALIALALARPAHQAGAGWGGGAAPVAAAVLLDRSYSTAFRQPGGLIFEQLRARAAALLEVFAARDEVAVIPFAGQPLPLAAGGDRGLLAQQVRELLPTQEATDLEQALQAAADFSAARPGLAAEVFLLTDLAQYNWDQVEEKQGWLPGARIYIADPGIAERGNLCVDQVRLETWLADPGKRLTPRVRLANISPQPAPQTSVDLYLDNERVRHQEVDLAAGAQLDLDLAMTPRRAGLMGGHVEVQDDALALDNRRYFTLCLPDSIRVLVLGHQPEDTYYPRRALSASIQADPALSLRVGLFSELEPALLQGVQVALLCNLQRLSPEQTALLQDFASRGGNLILFPSHRADLNFYNRYLLPGLFPAQIKGVLGRPGEASAFQPFSADLPHHPLFDGLLTSIPDDQPRFQAFFELAAARQEPLIRFADGQPALVEGWREEGRVILFAIPLSLEWNDLPLKGLFVPLLHRLVRHLSLPPDHDRAYLVGQTVRRHLRDVPIESSIQAEAPSGRKQWISAEQTADLYYWKIPRVEEAGLWRLWKDGELVDLFAVNPDPREADLTPVPRERLLRLFGPERTRFIQPQDELRALVLGNRYGRELWRECLALALALLLAELWLARAPRRSSGGAGREG